MCLKQFVRRFCRSKPRLSKGLLCTDWSETKQPQVSVLPYQFHQNRTRSGFFSTWTTQTKLFQSSENKGDVVHGLSITDSFQQFRIFNLLVNDFILGCTVPLRALLEAGFEPATLFGHQPRSLTASQTTHVTVFRCGCNNRQDQEEPHVFFVSFWRIRFLFSPVKLR